MDLYRRPNMLASSLVVLDIFPDHTNMLYAVNDPIFQLTYSHKWFLHSLELNCLFHDINFTLNAIYI